MRIRDIVEEKVNRSIPWGYNKLCRDYGPGTCHRPNGKMDCFWECEWIREQKDKKNGYIF
jgi:hypothetical protein